MRISDWSLDVCSSDLATGRASLTPIGNDSEGASMSEAADEPQGFNRNTQIEGIQACDPCDPAHGTEEPYDEAGVLPRPIMIPHPSECLPRRKRKSKWLPRQDRRNKIGKTEGKE